MVQVRTTIYKQTYSKMVSKKINKHNHLRGEISAA